MKKSVEEPHDAKEKVPNGEPKVNLDTILIEEIGEFGRYQKQAFVLALMIALLGGFSGNDYVFTTARISTRCVIPECESSGILSENWLSIAIPIDGGSHDNCNRFNSSWVQMGNDSCSINNFDRDVIVPCEGYVYEKTDTIVYEFDLACQEWRRSVIGSASTFGMMLALPLTGIIADRYGRRFALALNAFNHGWLGLARYWAQSYGTFIALEFLAAVFGAAGFACAYIIGHYKLSLAVYLVGKYTISIVVTSLYVFTNELFPTQYRTRLFAFSSMVGRIGSISAPLTPALGSMVWEHLPYVLFGTLATVSGLLVLLAPETKGSRLPDTMKQASELGSKRSKSTL